MPAVDPPATFAKLTAGVTVPSLAARAAEAQPQQWARQRRQQRAQQSVLPEGQHRRQGLRVRPCRSLLLWFAPTRDQVLLSTKHVHLKVPRGEVAKLMPKYIGPFKVLERLGSAYRLALPRNLRMHPVFHVSLLRAYQSDDYLPAAAPA